MKYNLFLDDFRFPNDASNYMFDPIYSSVEWIIVRNYYAFITIIQNKGIPDNISFDHDLADCHYKNQIFDYDDETKEKTGYHCAKWLINYCIDNSLDLPKKINIHSMNPYGTKNIKSLFETFFKINNINYKPINTIDSWKFFK